MILTKELRKAFAKKLDDLIKLPNWAELFDRMILNVAIDYIDEHYGENVPDEFIDDIQKTVELFVNDDYIGILEVIPNVINDIVDIPGLNEDLEGKFFAINLKAIFEFIQYYAERKK